ncbi:MAG: FAD-dependent oxidoreductase [Lachnospiraceae bacterium]|nr:FAD-dependent oxidoreductase [Lachnospiraceae bacterium]
MEAPGKERIRDNREVIVIGAGMAGLLTAFFLKEQGIDVLVLEAKEIGSGQTGRTTAKITSQHGLKYSSLIKSIGVERARMYAQANEQAIREYERLIRDHGIECEFKRVLAYLYTTQDEELLKMEEDAATLFGIDAFFTTETELPFSVKGALCFRNQARFDPHLFMSHISRELEVWEHTRVSAVRGNQVILEDRVLTAEKIIAATHYPFRNVPGFYFLREHQERSYVLELAGCDKIEGMYYGIDKDGLSFRQAGDFLLLGGGSHRTGQEPGEAYRRLTEAAKRYFPDCRIQSRWSAQDCMPHDGVPFIGRYSVFTPDLYVITGFQKWGMTSSMIAAMILRDELCGRQNPYAKLFSPQRVYGKASIGNLLLDVGMSIKGLYRGLFRKTPGRCSHMGCGLEWNPEEESWDCPCHGSRFSVQGKLLDNPAKKDAEIKK